MTIQAVFFDMGGTIQTYWHSRELRLEATPALQKLLRSSGIDLHLSDEQLYQVVTDGLARYHRWAINTLNEIPAAQIWSEYILADYPVDQHVVANAAEDLMYFIDIHYYQRDMRPEMPAVLQAVQAMGLKTGLISNVHGRKQVPCNLEQYGLRQYFDPVVLSCDYGRRKPDPAIFHYAARLASTPTSACVYIGDRAARDILGARKAGYRLAIQIQHDFDHSEDDLDAQPDAYIHQMTELVDILRSELDHSANEERTQEARSRPLRALLFDAGDILYYRPHRHVVLMDFLKELALDLDKPPSREKKELTDQAYTGRIGQEQYREAVLRLYGVSHPDQIERGKRILEQDDHDIHFFPGVTETLAELKRQGFLLGIVTDTAAPLTVKLSWFERGGFGHVWDTVISSKELGVRKPDSQIYQAALKQLGLEPGQAVFVGHNAGELEGARRVGMQTIAFNYEESAVADCYIEEFSDLLKIPLVSASFYSG
jgi:putative hydrolase of the HAD superfamily